MDYVNDKMRTIQYLTATVGRFVFSWILRNISRLIVFFQEENFIFGENSEIVLESWSVGFSGMVG
jgi:hypothetical protein